MQEIADFSLMWPQLLLTDYQFTGDKEFLRQYYPTAKGIIEHFRQYEREDGLLEQVGDKWNLVDWPENLRDGYDFDLSRPVVAPRLSQRDKCALYRSCENGVRDGTNPRAAAQL